jgi:ectoine hydroxylase-related dioxygenase (phytanoyl-CoA dioxygenase family)
MYREDFVQTEQLPQTCMSVVSSEQIPDACGACSAFLTTQPLSCVGVWLAIEDATLQNGCLFAASASHLDGVRGRMVLDESKTGVTWGSGKPDFSDLTLEPLEVKAGTMIVLHGSNVHGSNANTSDISRHAYSMHVVEGDGAEWLPDNWLQRSDNLPFEPLY